MKINLKTKIKNLDGTVIKQDVKEGSTVTSKEVEVKNLLIMALQADAETDSMDTKRRVFELMVAISTAKNELDIKSEDVTIIKTRCYKIFSSLVAGQLELILEGKETPF